MATGLLILVGSQLGPWHLPGSQPPDSGEQRAAAKKESPAAATPVVTPPATPPVVAPEDAKPSPVSPPVGQAHVAPMPVNPEPVPARGFRRRRSSSRFRAAKSEPEVVKPAAADGVSKMSAGRRRCAQPAPQEVMFTSSPGGATATLDGNSSMACTTPCSLTAAQGKHTVVLTMPGYEIVRRDFTVGAAPLELTPFALTAVGGTLMLTSVPDGAAISVNGKRIDKVTPAEIPLGLGTSTRSWSRRAGGRPPSRWKSSTASRREGSLWGSEARRVLT